MKIVRFLLIHEMSADTVKTITIPKPDNLVVIDSEKLTHEQKEIYIEYTIHIAAPKIAKLL